jgi:type IV pilus assembly protein PilX
MMSRYPMMQKTEWSGIHLNQGGAALVVGLVLLIVITVLAISGMNTATTELAMARNNQNYENAFQAAETGLELALSRGSFSTIGDVSIDSTVNANDSVTSTIVFEESTFVPDRAFSLGVGSGVAAYHFNAIATAESRRQAGGTTDRDASAVHTQAFYVVGPEAPTL